MINASNQSVEASTFNDSFSGVTNNAVEKISAKHAILC
jgi:hypothetical protein